MGDGLVGVCEVVLVDGTVETVDFVGELGGGFGSGFNRSMTCRYCFGEVFWYRIVLSYHPV